MNCLAETKESISMSLRKNDGLVLY